MLVALLVTIVLPARNKFINYAFVIDIAINKRRVERISLDAIKYLEAYDFPGNYRELEFILRQAVNNAFADGSSCICFRHIYNKLKY